MLRFAKTISKPSRKKWKSDEEITTHYGDVPIDHLHHPCLHSHGDCGNHDPGRSPGRGQGWHVCRRLRDRPAVTGSKDHPRQGLYSEMAILVLEPERSSEGQARTPADAPGGGICPVSGQEYHPTGSFLRRLCESLPHPSGLSSMVPRQNSRKNDQKSSFFPSLKKSEKNRPRGLTKYRNWVSILPE